jgi:hypothetical protein
MGMERWWNDTDRGNWSAGRETLYSVGGRWMNGVEHWWNDTDRGQPKCWEKSVPPPPPLLCPQQILHGLTWVRYRIFAVSDWRLVGCSVLKTNKTYERSNAARSVAIVAVEKQWEYVLHSHCVLPVALVVQHAERMRHITLSSVACLTLPYFSTLSYKQHTRKRFLNIQCVFRTASVV